MKKNGNYLREHFSYRVVSAKRQALLTQFFIGISSDGKGLLY